MSSNSSLPIMTAGTSKFVLHFWIVSSGYLILSAFKFIFQSGSTPSLIYVSLIFFAKFSMDGPIFGATSYLLSLVGLMSFFQLPKISCSFLFFLSSSMSSSVNLSTNSYGRTKLREKFLIKIVLKAAILVVGIKHIFPSIDIPPLAKIMAILNLYYNHQLTSYLH
jgi:hypothetical protein